MDKNYEIIQDILSRAIQITVSQKQDVSWEFYPLTKVLQISISFNGKCNKGLTKTYSVKVEDIKCLEMVQQELMLIQAKNVESNLDDKNFLGD